MNAIFYSLTKNERAFGISLSAILHVFLFVGVGGVLIQPVQYAVERGSGGMEVSLVSAPAEAVKEEVFVPDERSDLALPFEEHQVQDASNAMPENKITQVLQYKGDGSSPVPGHDQTTFSSSGGAISEAEPSYLKNPAPVYPLEARRNGWAGSVVVKVTVNALGAASAIKIEQSSMFEVLDRSALQAIRKWRFKPARLGNIPIESTVLVPIRFDLEDK